VDPSQILWKLNAALVDSFTKIFIRCRPAVHRDDLGSDPTTLKLLSSIGRLKAVCGYESNLESKVILHVVNDSSHITQEDLATGGSLNPHQGIKDDNRFQFAVD